VGAWLPNELPSLESLSLSAPALLPIRLSLCRERLAWGVPQRATLFNAAAGRSKTHRVRNQNL